MDGFQQADPRLAVRAVGHRDQADIQQLGSQFQRAGAGRAGPAESDRRQGVEAAAAGEHPGPAQDILGFAGQQAIAPRDGMADGLLAGRAAGIGRGQVQGAKPGVQRPRGQQIGAGRGQFDSQRQPIEAPADRHDVGGVTGCEREPWPDHLRVLEEHLHRPRSGHLRQPTAARKAQRRHRVVMLPCQTQRPPRSGHDHQLRRGLQELRYHPGGPCELLDVVQHQQSLLVSQVPGSAISGWALAGDVKAAGDGRPHPLRVADGRQGDEEDALAEELAHRGRGGHREPRLPHAPRTGQCHQAGPGLRHDRTQELHVAISPHQRRQ